MTCRRSRQERSHSTSSRSTSSTVRVICCPSLKLPQLPSPSSEALPAVLPLEVGARVARRNATAPRDARSFSNLCFQISSFSLQRNSKRSCTRRLSVSTLSTSSLAAASRASSSAAWRRRRSAMVASASIRARRAVACCAPVVSRATMSSDSISASFFRSTHISWLCTSRASARARSTSPLPPTWRLAASSSVRESGSTGHVLLARKCTGFCCLCSDSRRNLSTSLSRTWRSALLFADDSRSESSFSSSWVITCV
mmetsp:Transcript_105469/g.264084  ORF Transcript_105469/g.264084 Transcript_105469/m.264084 type:complete len:255 (-) Transcript_105469:2201-2965(-)